MLLAGDSFDPAGAMFVAKWGNGHCTENKARIDSAWSAPDVAVLEPFFAGEAVRIVGIDYMAGEDGTFHVLEVNHIPNVTVFPFMRSAFLDLAVEWVAMRSAGGRN
jgi:hypothetical protein